MIKIRHRGNFNHTEQFFERIKNGKYIRQFDRYGREGVAALSAATPVDTGKTAASWYYEIVRNAKGSYSIQWKNSNVNGGVVIAVLIQYGHGTKSGAYVQGVDYINPALRSVFEQIADNAWKEVIGS